MYNHVTVTGPVNVSTGHSRKTLIQFNAALTGNVIVSDETSTASTPIIATITNPTVGSQYEYWDIKNGVTVNPSTTTDFTISVSSGMGGNQ